MNWLANGLIMLNLYYWSQRDPNYQLKILFWRLPARLSPYVYIALRFLLGSFPLQQILASIFTSAYINLQDSGALPILMKSPGSFFFSFRSNAEAFFVTQTNSLDRELDDDQIE